MKDAHVTLHNGKVLVGPIWEWRPKEGYFTIVNLDGGDPIHIFFDDVSSAWQEEFRTYKGIEKVDLLQSASEDGWSKRLDFKV